MHSKSFLLACAAILCHTVVADEYSGDGNVDMTIGSESPLAIGNVSPATVLDTLNQHCSTQTCDANPYTMDTELTNKSSGENTPENVISGTITVTVVDATISADDDLPGMIEALKDLAAQPQITVMTTEHTCTSDDTTDPVAPGRRSRFRRDVTCDRPELPSIDQYSTARTFYIRVNNEDGALRSEMRVKIEAGVDDDELSKTICEDLASAGAAVAGLFTGGAALAAGFSLGGLACGAL